MRNILTIGTFDLFHAGHVELLVESRKIADQHGANLIVGINTDEFVERYKGHKPRLSYDARVAVVGGMKGVDAVVKNIGDEDAKPLIEVVNPILLTIGDDWLDLDYEGGPDEQRYLSQLGIDRLWMVERGLYVMYIPRTKGISSSVLRKD